MSHYHLVDVTCPHCGKTNYVSNLFLISNGLDFDCAYCDMPIAEPGDVEADGYQTLHPETLTQTTCPLEMLQPEGQGATKPTNPKDALGIKKVPYSTIPANIIALMACGMAEGALKYGRHNYRMPELGVRASVYYDATMRHLTAHWEGQDIDPDSNLPHLAKAMCSLAVWLDATMRGNCEDDRPPAMPDGWLDDLNAHMAALLEKYPDPKPAYTQKHIDAAE